MNEAHLPLLELQATRRASGGYIVTNANCSAIGLVLALKPLDRPLRYRQPLRHHHAGGQRRGLPRCALRSTSSATSSPLSATKKKKCRRRSARCWAATPAAAIEPLPAKVSAHCNRVAVLEGHTECVSIKLQNTGNAREQVLEAWAHLPAAGRPRPALRAGPSCPLHRPGVDRPQPRLDVNAGKGMSYHRRPPAPLQPCSTGSSSCSATTSSVRGAAGAAVLNAEVLARAGKLPKRTRGATHEPRPVGRSSS